MRRKMGEEGKQDGWGQHHKSTSKRNEARWSKASSEEETVITGKGTRASASRSERNGAARGKRSVRRSQRAVGNNKRFNRETHEGGPCVARNREEWHLHVKQEKRTGGALTAGARGHGGRRE